MIDERGQVKHLYNEEFDLSSLGRSKINRASFVEPDESSKWIVMNLNQEIVAGPFQTRTQALDWEKQWVEGSLSG